MKYIIFFSLKLSLAICNGLRKIIDNYKREGTICTKYISSNVDIFEDNKDHIMLPSMLMNF